MSEAEAVGAVAGLFAVALMLVISRALAETAFWKAYRSVKGPSDRLLPQGTAADRAHVSTLNTWKLYFSAVSRSESLLRYFRLFYLLDLLSIGALATFIWLLIVLESQG